MCEGVPFVFEDAAVAGTVEEIDLNYGIWTPVKASQKNTLNYYMPVENEVFNFTETLSKQCIKK
jgi:hypothetical protein